MELTPKVQRLIGGLSAVTLLVGAVAAATYEDDDGDGGPGVEASGTSTTTATTVAVLPTDASGATVTVPGDPGVATTVAPVGTDPAVEPVAPPVDAPPATGTTPVPPATGEYRYEVTVEDGTVSESFLDVQADAAAPNDRLAGYRGASLGLIERYRWADDGVYVIGGTFTALGNAGCEWQPPVLQVRAPIAVGATWEGSSDCATSTDVGTISVHAETRTTVVELLDVDVAGRARRAARLSRDEDQVVTLASNTVRSTAHYDDVVDVATGLVISSSASATSEGQPARTSQRHLTAAPPSW